MDLDEADEVVHEWGRKGEGIHDYCEAIKMTFR